MPDSQTRKINFYIGAIAIVGAVLAYVFGSFSIIPDVGIAAPGWGQILLHIDKVFAIILGIFALRRMKLWVDQQKKPGKINWLLMLVFVPILLFAVWYVFLGVDLIPDSIPWVGWFDDALAILVAIWSAGKLKQMLFPKEK